jgi:hypothetical protein
MNGLEEDKNQCKAEEKDEYRKKENVRRKEKLKTEKWI